MNRKLILTLIIVFAAFLRLYDLQHFPPGLYSDEAAYGYNAYSILKTGRDEYGNFLPLTLKSFGDYKPVGTAYLTIPFVAIFGLNEIAVRLPSAIFGTVTIALVYFIAKEINSEPAYEKTLKFLPETASLMLAISPWHIHLTRSSMLVGIESALIASGFLFFIKGLKNSKFLFVSAASFVAAIYTYYGSRLTVLLLILSLVLIFHKRLSQLKTVVAKSIIFALILLLPMALSIVRDPSALLGRVSTISIFFDPGIKSKLWEMHTLDGTNFPPLVSRFFHNKPYFYFTDFQRRYLQHFSFDFLAVSGDPHPPFNIPKMGQLYLLEIPFIVVGLIYLISMQSKITRSLLAYLLIAPVAASLTFITPAANRSFNMVVPLTLASAAGILVSANYVSRKTKIKSKAFIATVIILYVASFTFYLNSYFKKIPMEIPDSWHYGRRQLVEKVSKHEDIYEKVLLTEEEGPTYIWLLFYKQYEPETYWESANITPQPDYLGWLHTLSFGKYYFEPDLNWEEREKEPKTLYVAYRDQLPDNWEGQVQDKNYKLVIDERILYPNGKTVYKIGHLSEAE